MKMRFFLLLAVFASSTLFAACNTTTATAPEKPAESKPVVPQDLKDQASCVKNGGEWVRGGLAGSFGCVLPAPDAGKSCTDSSQCTYRCFTNSGDNTSIGQTTTGQCQENSSPFGCRTEIVGGKVEPTLCVD